MIIDNGSGMNVISLAAMYKLKLPIEKHPKPHRFSWVDDNSTLVKQRCLVNFSLGNSYNEAMWCDIIPMRACHILLGRPWLFDQKVQCNGYRNTYSFLYKGKKLVLKPMKVQELRKFTIACMEQGLFIALEARPGAPAPAHYPLPTEISGILE